MTGEEHLSNWNSRKGTAPPGRNQERVEVTFRRIARKQMKRAKRRRLSSLGEQRKGKGGTGHEPVWEEAGSTLARVVFVWDSGKSRLAG